MKDKPVNKAKVGIFMPCYNMGQYIDESLDSLYKQTFKDFILIIADDASPSEETVRKLKKINHSNCKIYYEKDNMGLTRIANKYMALLDAEYIMLFNPDDKLHKDFLKEQVEYLNAHKDTHAVSTWVQEFEGGDRILKYTDELCTLPHMLIENNFSGAALMRKSAWLSVGMHDTSKDLYPNLDYDLWLSMLQKGYTLGTIPKPLFYWRVLATSLSHSMSASRMLDFRKALVKKYTLLYSEHSDFVINHYLEKNKQLEEYFLTNEEHLLKINEYNEYLLMQNKGLEKILKSSIQKPYMQSAAGKVKRALVKRIRP